MSEFEYVIIGSGVAAVAVANELLQNDPSLSIVMLEAGKRVPLKDRRKWWDFISTEINPYDDHHDLPLGKENQSIGDETWGFQESRLMGRGGSTVHWGGWSLRLKEEDFDTCSRTGRGADWPIDYEELEPYYCSGESFLAVSGKAEDSNGNVGPNRSKSYPLEAFPFVAADRPMIRAFEQLGIAYGHMPMARYRKCMTTGTCRYCPFGARFTAAYRLDELEDKSRFPNFELRDQSPCIELSVAKRNEVGSAKYLSIKTGKTESVTGRRFIIASGSYESPKLLLQSTSYYWPNGIGNDYDLVGRYLISHPFLHVRCVLPTNANRWNQELDFPTLMSRHFDTPEEQPFGKLFLFKDRSRPKTNLAEEMINGKTRSQLHRITSGPMEFELQGFMEEFSNPNNRVLIGDGRNRVGSTPNQSRFFPQHRLSKKSRTASKDHERDR